MNETKEDKLKLLKQVDMPYAESAKFPLEKTFRLAIIKDLIKDRLENISECFGYYDEKDEICKSCYLCKTGDCQELQNYIKFQRSVEANEDSIKIRVLTPTGEILTNESIQATLDKLKIKPTCASYKIAQALLESDNMPLGDVLLKINTIMGIDKKLSYVRVRFYQVKELLERKTDLKFKVVTQKYLHISKEIKDNESK